MAVSAQSAHLQLCQKLLQNKVVKHTVDVLRHTDTFAILCQCIAMILKQASFICCQRTKYQRITLVFLAASYLP